MHSSTSKWTNINQKKIVILSHSRILFRFVVVTDEIPLRYSDRKGSTNKPSSFSSQNRSFVSKNSAIRSSFGGKLFSKMFHLKRLSCWIGCPTVDNGDNVGCLSSATIFPCIQHSTTRIYVAATMDFGWKKILCYCATDCWTTYTTHTHTNTKLLKMVLHTSKAFRRLGLVDGVCVRQTRWLNISYWQWMCSVFNEFNTVHRVNKHVNGNK